MQMWFRKSKQWRRWMHLLRLLRSLEASVERTRSSMRLASRYFWTERMILMAQRDFFRRSHASTTLPNVPWPKSLTILSVESARSRILGTLTSVGQACLGLDEIVAVAVVVLVLGQAG